MISKWTANCATEEDAREMEANVLVAQPAFARLQEIIKEKQSATVTTVADYDCPSWAHKQADANGYNRAMAEILRYLQTPEI